MNWFTKTLKDASAATLKKTFSKSKKKEAIPLPGKHNPAKMKQKTRNELYYRAGDRHGFGWATILFITMLVISAWINPDRPIEDNSLWTILFLLTLGVVHLVWGHNLKKLADKS